MLRKLRLMTNLFLGRVRDQVRLEVAGEAPSDLAGLFRCIWSLGQAGAEIPLRIERDGRSFDQKVASSERNRFFKVPRMH